ncbi:MAG: peptidylprolyl isomerase [Candidatus Portnoybacteria bacterium CG10_big_fil_rev_8_21_14_0_10_36_7]|uniref:Peptidyl-prolyl cis-trans isomerase n=1 Tax=Candidatus Portnoybacteria bacterium CG10_big_fil_rev_8_21_14_0_10_36_7 TaxID=1974812 RepID=A0A2M8KD48_9BACT|nr:MAG: peptidylprolyl isomerase [Candidatus Portnoybacteria bacterium CG10_big_fil_rev_8_21_14_0_10_36_7]
MKNSLIILLGIITVIVLLGILKYSKTNTTPKSTAYSQTTNVNETNNMPKKQYESVPVLTVDKNKKYIATMTTSNGIMTFELNSKETPITTNNFVFLAKDGFYDGVIFHRIIKGSMIQGGDPLGTGMGGPGYKFNDEPITREYTKGTLAMANSGPNSNGSQFFIMNADYNLPKNYVIFGKLISGEDTLDKISSEPVTSNGSGEQSSPINKVVIGSITIEEK